MKGSCLCGQIEFKVNGPLPNLYQCHCSLCRKQTGANANAATFIKKADFNWLSNTESITSYQKDSGFRTDFCSRCGTPVPNPLRDSEFYWVPAGLLTKEVDTVVKVHLYCDSKAGWDVINESATCFDTMPSLETLYRLLSEQ